MGNILSLEDTGNRLNGGKRGLKPKKKLQRTVMFENGWEPGNNAQVKNNKRRGDDSERNGRDDNEHLFAPKSQSLDCICQVQYPSKVKEKLQKRNTKETTLEFQKLLIPRIKLKRNSGKYTEEKNSPAATRYSNPIDSRVLSGADNTKMTDNDNNNKIQSSIISSNNNNNILDESPKKPDENYFTKNFDECMKRLQLLEKEHELMEEGDSDIQLFYLPNKSENGEPLDGLSSPEVDKHDIKYKFNDGSRPGNETEEALTNYCSDNKTTMKPGERESPDGSDEENSFKFDSKESEKKIAESLDENEDAKAKENRELIAEWYSNLKQRFETNANSEPKREKAKEMSCRITGATLKNPSETSLAEDHETDTRHYFSNLVKSNKSLIDEELPNPDTVRTIRAKFQESLNSTLANNKLNSKLGGSMFNISRRKMERKAVLRPMSAQWNRDDAIREMQEDLRHRKESDNELSNQIIKRRLLEKYEKDMRTSKDYRNNRLFPPKWTDSGSVSSGVSSDLSSYDTDLESFSKEGLEPEPDDTIISDDDLLNEIKDKHYVQNEILEKIRSFGTSVTYYGGQMITCSIGSLLSPTTQAIMEEITQKYGHEPNVSRSFADFYRKYVEVNEPVQMKKLGRTRSFGQNDVFQKPNVLNNTEIEMYKYDLEMEIGIRKPKGLSQSNLKMNSMNKTHHQPDHQTSDRVKEEKSTVGPTGKPHTESQGINNNKVSPGEETCEHGNDTKTERVLNSNPQIPEQMNPNEISLEQHETKNEDKKSQGVSMGTKENPFLQRSQSAPYGITNSNCGFEHAKPEILFGYDVKVLGEKKRSDMEFEVFEVCENPCKNGEKVVENEEPAKLIHHPDEAKDERKAIPMECADDKNNAGEHKITRSDNNNDCGVDGSDENSKFAMDFGDSAGKYKNTPGEFVGGDGADVAEVNDNGDNEDERKNEKNNPSRWPIETRVLVDMQKNNEKTPTIISNGKTFAKTKIRLF